MTRLLTAPETTLPQGQFTSPELTLPEGTQRLLVNYTMPNWLAISDGQITVTLMISDDGGANYRTEWTDVFQHVRLTKGGVVQSSANFGIGLQAPFGPTSRLKVGLLNTVVLGVVTAITVDAT